jgi:hypothetical protein
VNTPTPGAVSAPDQQASDPQARLKAAMALIPGPQTAATAPTQETAPPAADVAPEAPKTAPLKDALTEWRAKREKAAQEAQKQAAYESENQKLKQELAAIKASAAFEDDPVAYAKARGWSKDDQILYAKTLIYELAPDEADPNFRVSMFEKKQAREAKAKEAEAEKTRKQAEEAEARETMMNFAHSIEQGVMTFEAGSYPESEAEFGDDVEGYLRSMFETATKMAAEAHKAGTQADLSPASIAKKLEADTAARVAAREKRRAMRTPPAAPAAAPQQSAPTPAADAMQSVLDTASTKSLGGGAPAPLPPARTEAERVQRAIALLGKQ